MAAMCGAVKINLTSSGVRRNPGIGMTAEQMAKLFQVLADPEYAFVEGRTCACSSSCASAPMT